MNIDTAVFEQPEFLSATHEQIGIWLRLYRYCASQENSGIIPASREWPDKHWQQIAGCTRGQLETESPLWFFRPTGLFLACYNILAQEYAQKMRKTARIAGESRSPAKQAAVRQNGKKGGRPRTIIPGLFSSNSTNLT